MAMSWESTNIKAKNSHQLHRLLMKNLTMAKDQDVMTCQEPPMKKVIIVDFLLTMTEAPIST